MESLLVAPFEAVEEVAEVKIQQLFHLKQKSKFKSRKIKLNDSKFSKVEKKCSNQNLPPGGGGGIPGGKGGGKPGGNGGGGGGMVGGGGGGASSGSLVRESSFMSKSYPCA